MATMLAAGISLLDSIESLQEESKGGMKKVMSALHDDISQGKKISESFAQFPDAFDPVTINLIEAAEEAGTLDTTLADLTVTIKKEIEFADKIKSAMMYPMFVVVVFFAIMGVILTVVIPKIAKVFLQLRVDLPLPTRILIFLSDFLMNNTLLFGLAIVAIVATVVILLKTQKKRFLQFLFLLPGLNTLARDMDITRFSRSLSLLLYSGIPILNALDLAQQVIVKKDILQVIQQSREVVAAGKKLSESFRENSKVLPGIMVRITQAGEKTGTLAKSMADLAEYFDSQVSGRVKVLTTLLEPVMLVGIAGLVGGMMLAIIAPIYSLIGQISPH
jgi:type II secretory pathway component PulF